MQPARKKSVNRRTLDSVFRFTSTIGENTEFVGSFNGGENIVVRGQVRGDSNVNGAVLIAETGKWDGKLRAEIVIIAGVMHGDIVASEKIEVLSGGKIVGNISSPVIAIETGAIHEGHMDMKSATRVERFYEKRNEPAAITEE